MSKRSLIALVVGLLVLVPAVLVGIAVWTGGDDSRRIGAIGTRSDQYERHYGMRLFTDGPGAPQLLGPLASFAGCATKATVSSATTADEVSGKHLTGAVTYEPCRLAVNLDAMQPAFHDLLDDVLTEQVGRRGFFIVMLNQNGSPKPDAIHIEAALVELAFPALDAGDGDYMRAVLELILRPQSVATEQNCCGSSMGVASVSSIQRLFINNFEVTISYLSGQEDTLEVSGFKAAQQGSGGTVDAQGVSSSALDVELSDVELVVARHPNGGFHEWFTDSVNDAPSGPANEMTMTITLKKADGQAGFTLSFTGVGIRGRESLGLSSQGTAGALLKDRFTLYVEGATWAVAGAASPPPPPPPPPPPAAAPTAPEAVKFEALGDGQVRLTWAPVEGADHYPILSAREPEGRYEPLADAKEAEHTLERLEPGTTIYVVVRAARGEAESENSPAIAIEVK